MSTTKKIAKKKAGRRQVANPTGAHKSKRPQAESANDAPLTQAQRKFLKGVAHSMKPIVSVGNKGLTAAVLEETKIAVDHHELIKIKLPAGEKSMRMQVLEKICADCNAQRVTLIGRTGVIYKPAHEPKIVLPK